MKKIPLRGKAGEGLFALVDDGDYARLSKFKWYPNSKGRAFRHGGKGDKSVTVLMSREIMSFPDGQVDHRNRIVLDNQRSNMRVATASENLRHRRPMRHNKSGYKGVFYHKRDKRWIAQIDTDGHRMSSRHDTAKEAALAYDLMAKEQHGEFAHLNFPATD